RAVGLTLRPGHTVIVIGYTGESFLRLGEAGAEVNEASPTAAGAGLVPRGGRGRKWFRRASRPKIVWHDARLRGLPPGVSRTRWRIPLVVDGRGAELAGELWRGPGPRPWPGRSRRGCTTASPSRRFRTRRPAAGCCVRSTPAPPSPRPAWPSS